MKTIQKEYIDKIIRQLKDIDVHKMISNKFTRVEKHFSAPEGYRIEGDRLEQECLLKEKIYCELKSCTNERKKELFKFIIQEWGGIRGFKSFDKCFGDKLESALKTLDCISSLSKIASFSNPKEYFIYDSQAVFSLNWLLLNAGYKGPFFPIPEGQAKNTKEYHLETIIRLMGYQIAILKGNQKETNVYEIYNKTILAIHNSMHYAGFDEERFLERPFLIEMLLYSYTDTAVENLKKVSITLPNKL